MRSNPCDFFAAVRRDDLAIARELLAKDSSLARARWPGRAGDGKMRSLGPSPFNQHTWHSVPAGGAPDDPRYTSTPLIYTRNDAMVRLLVEAGAEVNALGTSGELELPGWFFTPLWRAAHDGRMTSLRLLVERGAEVNFINPDGSNQALKSAAENNRLEVCEYLLASGAEPDLITAAMLGLHLKVEALLARHPESLRTRDAHGRNALDAATLLDTFRRSRAGLGPNHERVAQILMGHGAQPEIEHAASLNLLPQAEKMLQMDPGLLRRPKILPALITGTAIRESALSAAQRRGHKEMIALLLKHGAAESPPAIVA